MSISFSVSVVQFLENQAHTPALAIDFQQTSLSLEKAH